MCLLQAKAQALKASGQLDGAFCSTSTLSYDLWGEHKPAASNVPTQHGEDEEQE